MHETVKKRAQLAPISSDAAAAHRLAVRKRAADVAVKSESERIAKIEEYSTRYASLRETRLANEKAEFLLRALSVCLVSSVWPAVYAEAHTRYGPEAQDRAARVITRALRTWCARRERARRGEVSFNDMRRKTRAAESAATIIRGFLRAFSGTVRIKAEASRYVRRLHMVRDFVRRSAYWYSARLEIATLQVEYCREQLEGMMVARYVHITNPPGTEAKTALSASLSPSSPAAGSAAANAPTPVEMAAATMAAMFGKWQPQWHVDFSSPLCLFVGATNLAVDMAANASAYAPDGIRNSTASEGDDLDLSVSAAAIHPPRGAAAAGGTAVRSSDAPRSSASPSAAGGGGERAPTILSPSVVAFLSSPDALRGAIRELRSLPRDHLAAAVTLALDNRVRRYRAAIRARLDAERSAKARYLALCNPHAVSSIARPQGVVRRADKLQSSLWTKGLSTAPRLPIVMPPLHALEVLISAIVSARASIAGLPNLVNRNPRGRLSVFRVLPQGHMGTMHRQPVADRLQEPKDGVHNIIASTQGLGPAFRIRQYDILDGSAGEVAGAASPPAARGIVPPPASDPQQQPPRGQHGAPGANSKAAHLAAVAWKSKTINATAAAAASSAASQELAAQRAAWEASPLSKLNTTQPPPPYVALLSTSLRSAGAALPALVGQLFLPIVMLYHIVELANAKAIAYVDGACARAAQPGRLEALPGFILPPHVLDTIVPVIRATSTTAAESPKATSPAGTAVAQAPIPSAPPLAARLASIPVPHPPSYPSPLGAIAFVVPSAEEAPAKTLSPDVRTAAHRPAIRYSVSDIGGVPPPSAMPTDPVRSASVRASMAMGTFAEDILGASIAPTSQHAGGGSAVTSAHTAAPRGQKEFETVTAQAALLQATLQYIISPAYRVEAAAMLVRKRKAMQGIGGLGGAGATLYSAIVAPTIALGMTRAARRARAAGGGSWSPNGTAVAPNSGSVANMPQAYSPAPSLSGPTALMFQSTVQFPHSPQAGGTVLSNAPFGGTAVSTRGPVATVGSVVARRGNL